MDKYFKWIGIGFCLWIGFNMLPVFLAFLAGFFGVW